MGYGGLLQRVARRLLAAALAVANAYAYAYANANANVQHCGGSRFPPSPCHLLSSSPGSSFLPVTSTSSSHRFVSRASHVFLFRGFRGESGYPHYPPPLPSHFRLFTRSLFVCHFQPFT